MQISDSLKPRLTNEPEASPLKSAATWKPTPVESLNATKEEVLFAINARAVDKPTSYKGAPERLYRLIDVRSERAYLGKDGLGAVKHVPNMDAINIPWKQFFTTELRPNSSTLTQLRSMGFALEDRIIVLDGKRNCFGRRDHGVTPSGLCERRQLFWRPSRSLTLTADVRSVEAANNDGTSVVDAETLAEAHVGREQSKHISLRNIELGRIGQGHVRNRAHAI